MITNHKSLTIKDFFNTNARDYVKEKIKQSDAGLSESRFDIFGAELESLTTAITFFLFFYKYYLRVDVHGIENLPAKGGGLIVSNHAGPFPIDGAMLVLSALVEPENPRFTRTIVNKNMSTIPFFSTLMYRTGQVIGCDENVRHILKNNNLVLVFPTGAEGKPNSIFNKYKVAEFPLGFMEYALKYRTPIIPTCVTGSEEASLTLTSIDLPIHGFKHFPITPIFPWLGLIGLIPLPAKFDIYFEPPIDYSTKYSSEADNPVKIRELVDGLRNKIQDMLDKALGR